MEYEAFFQRVQHATNRLEYLAKSVATHSYFVARYLAFHQLTPCDQSGLEGLLRYLREHHLLPRILACYHVEIDTIEQVAELSERIELPLAKMVSIMQMQGRLLSRRLVSYLYRGSLLLADVRLLVTLDFSPSNAVLYLLFKSMQQRNALSAMLFARFGQFNQDSHWYRETFLILAPFMRMPELRDCCSCMVASGTDYPANRYIRDEPVIEAAISAILKVPLLSRYVLKAMREVIDLLDAASANHYLLAIQDVTALVLCRPALFDQLEARTYVQSVFRTFKLGLCQFVLRVLIANMEASLAIYTSRIFRESLVSQFTLDNRNGLVLMQALDRAAIDELTPLLFSAFETACSGEDFAALFSILQCGKCEQFYQDSECFLELLKRDGINDGFPVFEMLECLPFVLAGNPTLLADPEFCQALFNCFYFKHAKLAIPEVFKALKNAGADEMEKAALQNLKHESREIRFAAAFFLQDADLYEVFCKNSQYKQVKIAVLRSIYFCPQFRKEHARVLHTALQDADFDVRRTAVKASQYAILSAPFSECVNLLGLIFGNILNEAFSTEISEIKLCSSRRCDFDVFQQYLAGLLFSGNFRSRQAAWRYFDPAQLGVDGFMLGFV